MRAGKKKAVVGISTCISRVRDVIFTLRSTVYHTEHTFDGASVRRNHNTKTREERHHKKKCPLAFLCWCQFAHKKDKERNYKKRAREKGTTTEKKGDGSTSKNEEREGQPQEEMGEQNHRKKWRERYATSDPAVEYDAPDPAVTHAAPARVIEHVAPAHVVHDVALPPPVYAPPAVGDTGFDASGSRFIRHCDVIRMGDRVLEAQIRVLTPMSSATIGGFSRGCPRIASGPMTSVHVSAAFERFGLQCGRCARWQFSSI